MTDAVVDGVIHNILSTRSFLREVPTSGEDVPKWVELWMLAMNAGNEQSHYAPITQQIEAAFKRRCMQDALAVDRISNGNSMDKCPLQRQIGIAEDFNRRLSNRKTTHPLDKTGEFETLHLNVKLREAAGWHRQAVLSGLMVELLSLLPAVPKMLKRFRHESIVHIIDAQASAPQWCGEWKWPDGFWTPLVLAIFHHKHFKFKFTNLSEHCRNNDAFRSTEEFPTVAIKAIARMDDLEAFKTWLSRMQPDWHDDSDQGYAKVACDCILELNAVRCYKFVCTLDDPNYSCALPLLVLAVTHDRLYAAPRRITFDHPPLSIAMRRLMWGECGRKAAAEPPPPPRFASHHSLAEARDRRRSWVMDFLWEKVRWLVRVRFWAWEWLEIHGMHKMRAEKLADGTVVMLGEDAIECQDAHARSNGVNALASGADATLDGDLAIEAAKQRADMYRLMEMEVLEDSSEDEDSPKPKKPRRTYAELLCKAPDSTGPSGGNGGADRRVSITDEEDRKRLDAERQRAEDAMERERFRIEEQLVTEAEQEDDELEEGETGNV